MTGTGTTAPPYVPVASSVPEPPPGPGVQPPFVAPPTDGATARRWWAFGLAGGAALLVCVGGLFALGALVVFSVQTTVDQSRTVVTEYLTAIQQRQYAQAYALLCERQQGRVDEQEFIRTAQAEPPIASFTVGQPVLGEQLVVPATVHYRDGSVDQPRFVIEPDSNTGAFEVCGQEG